jgi:ferric-dicitrate binding protein FerR (iron transport regulator)
MFLKDSFDINSISYATKNFYFNDMPLEEICNHLQKAFGIAIILENDFSQCRVTAQFLNQPVNYILDVISATLNIHYYKSGNTVYLKGNNCN